MKFKDPFGHKWKRSKWNHVDVNEWFVCEKCQCLARIIYGNGQKPIIAYLSSNSKEILLEGIACDEIIIFNIMES